MANNNKNRRRIVLQLDQELYAALKGKLQDPVRPDSIEYGGLSKLVNELIRKWLHGDGNIKIEDL